ncbi:MAG: hypothetical protein PV362_01220, partial [Providencia heimbachae]|nr:hypothetical protein [Providencia heimbachae]
MPNEDAIRDVEQAMRERAEELAKEKLCAEETLLAQYPGLEKPAGAPMLTTMNVPKDEKFSALAEEHASLMRDPVANAEPLQSVVEQMNARVCELAAADEATALEAAKPTRELQDQYPMCPSGAEPSVVKDPAFAEMAAEREALLADPLRNAEALRSVEEAMHHRAVEVEAKKKRKRRPAHLGYSLEMSSIAAEEAGEVEEPDTQLPPMRSGRAVGESDGAGLDDPYFEELQALRDALVTEGAVANAPAIRCVEEQMKDRVAQLQDDEASVAKALQRREQALAEAYPYLPRDVEGIPLTELPLQDNEVFQHLATEHGQLAEDPVTNAEALKAKEEQLQACAAELADVEADKEQALRDELPFIGELPGKARLSDLPLDSSPLFTRLREQHEELA